MVSLQLFLEHARIHFLKVSSNKLSKVYLEYISSLKGELIPAWINIKRAMINLYWNLDFNRNPLNI